jgi:hypothetical protein
MYQNKSTKVFILSIVYLLVCCGTITAQWKKYDKPDLISVFKNPPESAKPWVFWYWMKAAVTKEGITADLEAMKEEGIGGAYLVPMQDPTNPPLVEPPAITFSNEWWDLLRFSFTEANRLGLKINLHCGDGYATAGGPWITPELSMQKVVWSERLVTGESSYNDSLSIPSCNLNYYRDIAVLAFPTVEGAGVSTRTVIPKITTSKTDIDAQFLIRANNKEALKSDEPCWIQYEFEKPFICRSIITKGGGTNYQSHRLRIETSNDGIHFDSVCRLQPPRHGWQDKDADYTHSIPETKARFFRFFYNKEESEPGEEDLDNAKWKPNLKLRGLELFSAPVINQYEGKNGVVWRLGKRTTSDMIPDGLCVDREKIVDLTGNFTDGRLRWNVPSGKWTILRIGYTTTGHQNYTGGAGKGLECDKLNPEVAKLQFDKWYGEIERKLGKDLTSKVLANIHVDSWECGSQNWSPIFMKEFLKRRGYDLKQYLPVFAGIPVESAEISERFLYDVRKTIAEMVADNFYGTLSDLAKAKGYGFTAESVAPIITSDGMLHFKYVDAPMGEFWVNSPTHDKPNDMLDAISAGHIYGKNIIQSEAFTTLRMDWSENPAMMKPIGDRNFALGINRFVFHVFCHNPWPDRKPGMTLGPIGSFFQPSQTWWKPAKAWVEYIQRCQALLQEGNPDVDIAVFTGEELPRRAVLPERLIETFPGLFNKALIDKEKTRLENKGQPMQEKPDGINCSANIVDPAQWVNPIDGFKYDSFNSDVLKDAKVVDGKVSFLEGSPRYSLLVFPSSWFKISDREWMSPGLVSRIIELLNQGAQILICNFPEKADGLTEYPLNDQVVRQLTEKLQDNSDTYPKTKKATYSMTPFGNGLLVHGVFSDNKLFEPDLTLADSTGKTCPNIAWTHRTSTDFDIYFLANQSSRKQFMEVSLRASGRLPEIWNAVTGEIIQSVKYKVKNKRTELPLFLEPSESVFIVMHETTNQGDSKKQNWQEFENEYFLDSLWTVQFDTIYGGPAKPLYMEKLTDWIQYPDSGIRYYSGTAKYSRNFEWVEDAKKQTRKWLDLGKVNCIANIWVNGIYCGTAWTNPFKVEITKTLKNGNNQIEIEITNTWINRILGDVNKPENKRITCNAFPFYRLEDKKLKESGLLGPVRLLED